MKTGRIFIGKDEWKEHCMKQTVRKMAGGAKSHGIPREGRKFYFGRTRIIKVVWSQVIGHSECLPKKEILSDRKGRTTFNF